MQKFNNKRIYRKHLSKEVEAHIKSLSTHPLLVSVYSMHHLSSESLVGTLSEDISGEVELVDTVVASCLVTREEARGGCPSKETGQHEWGAAYLMMCVSVEGGGEILYAFYG